MSQVTTLDKPKENKVVSRRHHGLDKPNKALLNKLRKLGKDCTPIKYVCAALGVAEETWYKYTKIVPELMAAYNEGRQSDYQKLIDQYNKRVENAKSETALPAIQWQFRNLHQIGADTDTEGPGSIDINVNIKHPEDSQPLQQSNIVTLDVEATTIQSDNETP
jgi:hypothetical protein